MKIILEFKNKFEHDKYCIEQTRMLEKETIDGVSSIKNGLPMNDFSRRKLWSELELNFVKENYMFKKVPWIGKQLRKKPEAVYAILTKMYKEGLPRKRSLNGKIESN